VSVAQHEGDRISVDFTPLDAVQRQKLLRDLLMYCDSTILRPCKQDSEAVGIIVRFRLGKSDDDLKAMETVTGILLDRAAYEQAPFSGQKLANTITEFLWQFKERLDFEMWQLLEQNFDMAFVVLKDDLPFLKENMQKIVTKLDQLSGPTPVFSPKETELFIRSKLRDYSQHQVGIVSLKREILEVQLSEEHKLQNDEYIPFYESLFVAWNENRLPLLDVSFDTIRFDAMKMPKVKAIEFDEKSSELHVREKIIKIAKHKSEWNLLRVLCRDQDSLEKDWQFSELREEIDSQKKDKDFYNYANQLKMRLRSEGIKDFLFTTSHSLQVNTAYIDKS
jgi:hypothetical protein